jgi:hypothetical protein
MEVQKDSLSPSSRKVPPRKHRKRPKLTRWQIKMEVEFEKAQHTKNRGGLILPAKVPNYKAKVLIQFMRADLGYLIGSHLFCWRSWDDNGCKPRCLTQPWMNRIVVETASPPASQSRGAESWIWRVWGAPWSREKEAVPRRAEAYFSRLQSCTISPCWSQGSTFMHMDEACDHGQWVASACGLSFRVPVWSPIMCSGWDPSVTTQVNIPSPRIPSLGF